MPVLTPLRYRRYHPVGQPKPIPSYGSRIYTTACGRFTLNPNNSIDGNWEPFPKIEHPHFDQWRDWFVNRSGLFNVTFTTRREAVEVLTNALELDGLVNVNDPTAVLIAIVV